MQTKNILLIVGAVIMLIFFSCQGNYNQQMIKSVESIISAVQKEHAPDKRTAWFQVMVEARPDRLILNGESAIPAAKEQLIAELKSLGIEIADSINVLPESALGEKTYGLVRLSVANIRSQPKNSAELATQALMGEQLRVWKKEGGWYFVQTPNNYFGWLDQGAFVLINETELRIWRSKEKVLVLEEFTKVYGTSAFEENTIISDLVAGNILEKELSNAKVGQAINVRLPDGRKGYVKVAEVSAYQDWLSRTKADEATVIQTAKSFMGHPYLWGGTSAKGMDCSGYTKTVYFLNGIQLERDASLQVHTGIEIETDTATWKNLLPGDLLFFGRKATVEEKQKIWHVAIWLGEGKIIHAAELVKIESLIRGTENFAEDRLLTFVKAKRVLNSVGKNGIVALKDSPFYQN